MGDRLATIDKGRKVGRGYYAPFRGGELGPHLTQCGILIHPTVWPQYTNVTDMTDIQDNGPVA